MKRILFAVVGIVIIAGAVGGVFALVWYLQPPPFTVRELEEMQDDIARAAKETPRIIACFDFNDEDVRLQAAITLGNVGAPAVDPLRAKLKDKNPKVRFCAVQALVFMGADAAPASGDLVACLDDSDADVRRKAVYALGRLGGNDAVFEGLIKALSDRNPSVISAAFEALAQAGAPPKEALPALTKLALKRDHGSIEAIKLLGKMGEPAVPALQELLKRMNRDADDLRGSTLLQAVKALGGHAKPLLPELTVTLLSHHYWIYMEDFPAIFTACGPDGAKALASLITSMDDSKSPHWKASAGNFLTFLGRSGPQAKDVVPTLVEMLKERPHLRVNVLLTLGDIGPAAREAIPAVEALRNDPVVGQQARVALKRMGVIEQK